jgi:pimeloyl-ACP methyl ester carboxylesterase
MRIESLLSARLFMAPQLVGEHIYFVSDLSGRLSLYRMANRPGGSVPEPLLPPNLALQNPHLVGGYAFYVFPRLGQIMVMLDQDGDENYQPMLIPMAGGFPEPALGGQLAAYRNHAGRADIDRGVLYFVSESRQEAKILTFRANLESGALDLLAESQWGYAPDGVSADHRQIILNEGYTVGDNVLYRWQDGERTLLHGTPLDQREPGRDYGLPAFGGGWFVNGDQGVLIGSALFSDSYGPVYLDLNKDAPAQPEEVAITGQRHTGNGELVGLEHLDGDRFAVAYNIDGVSWLYEGALDVPGRELRLEHVIAGQGAISNGVLESYSFEKASGTYALSYSTAISPTQLYTVGGAGRDQVTTHTQERVLGIAPELLSPGEDASFVSHDGLRTSARLYLPAASLGFAGPRPLVYYVHGGPQGQERPDFAWFSMPLIQFLTLNGFAVFVPNARGSTGYGLSYTKRIDHDWGGADRLDHIHAMTQVLPNDPRLDVKRAAVVGRSYGGYMTLTLAARAPELWAAAVDMFGPYDLLTFMDRIPETWKPYFRQAIGNPDVPEEKAFLVERSPATHIANLACPLLVIQGKNDPRVVEPESRDVVERLLAMGKTVDYLVFENEGHDVLKYENKVRCYSEILSFFQRHLGTQTGSGG